MRSRILAGSGAALLLVSLTACSFGGSAAGGSAAGGASPSPTRTDSVSSSDAPSDASSTPAASGDVDLSKPSGSASAADYPCNLYPISVISDLMGRQMQTASPVTAVGEPDQKSCLYDTKEDGGHEFAIEIALSNGPAHLSTWKLIDDTGGPVSATDVLDADEAWGDDSELAAVYGNVFVEAGDQSDASNDSATLVKVGLDKLQLMVAGLYASTLK